MLDGPVVERGAARAEDGAQTVLQVQRPVGPGLAQGVAELVVGGAGPGEPQVVGQGAPEQVEKLGGPLPETLKYGDAGEVDFEQILSLEPDLIIGLYTVLLGSGQRGGWVRSPLPR
ncbi:hypothetical protein ACFWUT_12005 [Streptomyces cyaneofuscatus]|uniref:hypothetical protein n=1 Tax=Streptomyces cyaneofuscatus TaxID=66883 RepID=UPI00365280F1